MKFRDFLNEKSNKEAVNALYGDKKSFLEDIKDFFTGNWMAPMELDSKSGIKLLKKKGFDDKEIKQIRNAVYVSVGEAINKFDSYENIKNAKPDKNNFYGWTNSGESIIRVLSSNKKIKEFVKKRVLEILNKGK